MAGNGRARKATDRRRVNKKVADPDAKVDPVSLVVNGVAQDPSQVWHDRRKTKAPHGRKSVSTKRRITK